MADDDSAHPASEGWVSVTRFVPGAFEVLRADGYVVGPETPFELDSEQQVLERVEGGEPHTMDRAEFIERYIVVEWFQL